MGMEYKNAVVLMFAVMAASSADTFNRVSAAALKALENDGKELAILDPREEGSYGLGHLLHAVNIPLSKLELNVDVLVPRRSTRIVLTDVGEGTAERAAVRLKELGYTNLAVLEDGYPAWKRAGYEIFSGMSVPGKAFGEWIALHYETPEITAEEQKVLKAGGEEEAKHHGEAGGESEPKEAPKPAGGEKPGHTHPPGTAPHKD